MARPEKIKLGLQEFEIQPMNFAALEDVEDGFAALGAAIPGRERFKAYKQILLAGIRTTQPDFPEDALDRIPAVEKRQIMDAIDAIARVPGMATQPGEEKADAGKEPAASTAPGTN